VSQQTAPLTELIKTIVESLNYELWGVSFRSRVREQTLSVFIDKPQGVTLDDCARVSRALSQGLDEADPIHGAYLLEVSSPGLDRPLFTPAQFEKYIGEEVRIEVRTPINGQRRFKGRLLSATPKEVCVEDKRQQIYLLMEDVLKANLVPNLG